MKDQHKNTEDVKCTATGIHTRLDQHEVRMTRQEAALTQQTQNMELQLDL